AARRPLVHSAQPACRGRYRASRLVRPAPAGLALDDARPRPSGRPLHRRQARRTRLRPRAMPGAAERRRQPGSARAAAQGRKRVRLWGRHALGGGHGPHRGLQPAGPRHQLSGRKRTAVVGRASCPARRPPSFRVGGRRRAACGELQLPPALRPGHRPVERARHRGRRRHPRFPPGRRPHGVRAARLARKRRRDGLSPRSPRRRLPAVHHRSVARLQRGAPRPPAPRHGGPWPRRLARLPL
ncbi:MAG: RNA binding S1 domain protein, partial [uncultured Sphingomonas sp.]